MKNLTNALQKGNLKPKERVLLVVHDAVKKEKTGKGLLTEAEIHALTTGWQPANNEEVKEYNRYHKGWRTAGFAELDAQTTYLDALLHYYREGGVTHYLATYPIFKEAKLAFERLQDIKAVGGIPQAQEIVNKQREVKLKGGINIDYAVYQLAFESLEQTIKEDILLLEKEADYEPSYLEEEEMLTSLLENGKLPEKNKEKLADKIVKSCYNAYAKEWHLWRSYASIPCVLLGRKWIEKRNPDTTLREDEKARIVRELARKKVSENRGYEVTAEEAEKELREENAVELIEMYAKQNKTTVKAELKAVVLELIEEGLIEDYSPISISHQKNTHNGETTHYHDEIYKEWIKAKDKATNTLAKIIKEGKLQRDGDIITGESLYSFKSEYEFVKDFKETVDRYDVNLGLVYANDDPEHKGKHLDRELLITNVDKNGKPNGFGGYAFALNLLKNYVDETGLVIEKEDADGRYITFREEKILGGLLLETTTLLSMGYAELLAFRDLFEKLSRIYEIDLGYKVNKWIGEIEEKIDDHNESVRKATTVDLFGSFKKTTLKAPEEWYINKDEVKPDNKRVKGYIDEFVTVFGKDF